MAELSQQSGLSAGQLYRYFDSKDALVNHDAPPTSLQDESRRRAAIELLLTLINGAVCRTFHEEDIDSAITTVVTRFLSAAVRA